VARGFPDWKKFPKPKSAKKEKKKKRENSQIRTKLTGLAIPVAVLNIDCTIKVPTPSDR